MIELRQFRQFIAVAEELSFRRAAERLHMAQPPLTAAIQRMEEELGLQLFERNNRIVRITDAGEVFLREARRTVVQAERALQSARRASAGLQGGLRINFVDSTANYILPSILKSFHQSHPDVEVLLQEATTADQLLSLQSDRIDAGLVVLPINPEAALRSETVYRDHWVAAVHYSHPVAKRDGVALSELRDEPWILFPGRYGPGIYERIVAACEASGFAPRIVQRVRLMQTAVGLVAGGVGIALVPRLLTMMRPRGVRFLEISGPGTPIPYDIALISANDPCELCAAFVEAARCSLTQARVPLFVEQSSTDFADS